MANIWYLWPYQSISRIIFKHLGFDTFQQTYEPFLFAGDFSTEETGPWLSETFYYK